MSQEFSRFERIPSTHDLSWLLDLHRNEQLDLDPTYQRRSVWTPKDRRAFMDTIFRNYPSPAIFLHKSIDEATGTSTYHVVDGKQRITTILQFIANKVYLPHDFGDANFNGKRWRDFGENPDAKKLLWNYRITVEQLDDIESVVVKDVFERLNKNNSKLTRQELRHARFDGWLITYLEEEVRNTLWADFKIRTTAKEKRMTEVQNISELAAIAIRKDTSGFDQFDLDELYAEYDDADTPESTFDTEAFTEQFQSTKEQFRLLDEHAAIASKVSQPFLHFYTLWAYLTQHPLSEDKISDFSDTYLKFMSRVSAFNIDENPNVDIEVDAGEYSPDDYDKYVAIYKSASVGATTEGPQRRARLESLKRAVGHDLGVPSE